MSWLGQESEKRKKKRKSRLVGVAGTSGELAEWHRLQQKNSAC